MNKMNTLNEIRELELLRVLAQRLAYSLERWINYGIPINDEQDLLIDEDDDSRIQTARDRIERRRRENEKDIKLIRTYKEYEKRRRKLSRS